MRLAWRPPLTVPAPAVNAGIVLAVLVASLAAGFIGGVIVWAVWRYDLLRMGHRRDP
jgi:uncharacterized protein (DUF2062 family)